MYAVIGLAIEYAKRIQIARIRAQCCVTTTAIARQGTQRVGIQSRDLHRASGILHERAVGRWQGRASRGADTEHIDAVTLRPCIARGNLRRCIGSIAEDEDLSMRITSLRELIGGAADRAICALSIDRHGIGRERSQQIAQVVGVVAQRRDGEGIACIGDQTDLSALASDHQLLDLQARAQQARWRQVRREHVRGHVQHHHQWRRRRIQRGR